MVKRNLFKMCDKCIYHPENNNIIILLRKSKNRHSLSSFSLSRFYVPHTHFAYIDDNYYQIVTVLHQLSEYNNDYIKIRELNPIRELESILEIEKTTQKFVESSLR